MASYLSETTEGVILRVRVQPRACRDEVVGRLGDVLKIRLSAAPVAGVANRQLLKFLARKLKLPRRQLSIRSGASARNKYIAIRGISAAEFEARVGLGAKSGTPAGCDQAGPQFRKT